MRRLDNSFAKEDLAVPATGIYLIDKKAIPLLRSSHSCWGYLISDVLGTILRLDEPDAVQRIVCVFADTRVSFGELQVLKFPKGESASSFARRMCPVLQKMNVEYNNELLKLSQKEEEVLAEEVRADRSF